MAIQKSNLVLMVSTLQIPIEYVEELDVPEQEAPSRRSPIPLKTGSRFGNGQSCSFQKKHRLEDPDPADDKLP